MDDNGHLYISFVETLWFTVIYGKIIRNGDTKAQKWKCNFLTKSFISEGAD